MLLTKNTKQTPRQALESFIKESHRELQMATTRAEQAMDIFNVLTEYDFPTPDKYYSSDTFLYGSAVTLTYYMESVLDLFLLVRHFNRTHPLVPITKVTNSCIYLGPHDYIKDYHNPESKYSKLTESGYAYIKRHWSRGVGLYRDTHNHEVVFYTRLGDHLCKICLFLDIPFNNPHAMKIHTYKHQDYEVSMDQLGGSSLRTFSYSGTDKRNPVSVYYTTILPWNFTNTMDEASSRTQFIDYLEDAHSVIALA